MKAIFLFFFRDNCFQEISVEIQQFLLISKKTSPATTAHTGVNRNRVWLSNCNQTEASDLFIYLFYMEIFHHKTIITTDTSMIHRNQWTLLKLLEKCCDSQKQAANSLHACENHLLRKKEMKKSRKIKFNACALIKLPPIRKGTNWLHN